MNDLKNEAREFLERAKEKMNPIVEDVKEKTAPVLDEIMEKAAPVVEDVKEAAAELKEKAIPVIGKAKTAAGSAMDAVKEGAEKIGDLFESRGPGLNIKNELFDELEAQAIDARDAAMAKAEEMQRRLEELMGGKKED